MKTLIITAGLFLSLTQVACAAGNERVTGGAPILENIASPEAIVFDSFGKTAEEVISEDIKITDDSSVSFEAGCNIHQTIKEDLQITETVIEPVRPLDALHEGHQIHLNRSGRLLGSL